MKEFNSIQPTRPDTNQLIGLLDRVLSEFLILTEKPGLDEADAQTLKHHADDLIGVGQKALETLKARMDLAPAVPASNPLDRNVFQGLGGTND